MESVTKFLETNLKLKVNKDKSAVAYVAKKEIPWIYVLSIKKRD